MISVVIKSVFTLMVVALWLIVTYGALSATARIWKVRNIDWRLTLRQIIGSVIMDPFAPLVEKVREVAELQISLTPQEGFTFTPRGGELISGEALRDRRQYSLVLANQGKETFSPVELRIQLPYPVSWHEVGDLKDADGATFTPIGLRTTFSGEGKMGVVGHPILPNYQLHLSTLRPNGRAEILFVLNSQRDPRGKTIPKAQEAWYSVPDARPATTYIYGHFKYRVGAETIEREYYAPLALAEDKTVTLGPPGPRPKVLRAREGFEMEQLW
jgi:hypothetical protein